MERLRRLLAGYRAGEISEETVLDALKTLPFEELEFAKVDHHRALRTGVPEVIFCQGKTPVQGEESASRLLAQDGSLLAKRADAAAYDAISRVAPDAVYHEAARVVTVTRTSPVPKPGKICVVTAGTADIPVAEEAAVVAEALGNTVDRIFDVGVAGIHRLFARIEQIRTARVVIVVAGMEGALASVVGGLCDAPVIAVPTSVGYGAAFGGISALLTMLNSCAAGVGVMNIDNGFGAAMLANKIGQIEGHKGGEAVGNGSN